MAEPNMGRAEPFRGQASDVCFSQSPWFNADEIPADSWGGYVVQIEEVRARRGVRFNKGKARDVELFLKFAGIEKELRVNVTIRRTLDSLLGPICADWFGKWITLFVQGGIDTSEGKKNGVRVKPSLPPQSAPKGQPKTVSEATSAAAEGDDPFGSSEPAPAPAPAAPVEAKKPDFVSDVIASAAELAKSGADGKATVQRAVTDAGLAGRKPSTWTKEEAGRVNAGLPPPFRVVF